MYTEEAEWECVGETWQCTFLTWEKEWFESVFGCVGGAGRIFGSLVTGSVFEG
eukprot:m.193880 g.193880  ORF g.193880 m.193880 type:complete len:53 (+) comp15444_c1_seq1:2874-3032(+)